MNVEHLPEILIDLTDRLLDDVDPIEFLQLVTTRTASMSQSSWAGVTLVDPDGTLQLVAVSTESPALREIFELEEAQGPWLDCFRSGSSVVNIDLTQAQDRWPALVPRAVSAGLRSVSAFPLRGGKDVIGALNFVSSDPDHLQSRDGRILQAIADVATMGLLHGHNSQGRLAAAAHLHRSLATWIAAEQAKGVLAESRDISVAAASALIGDHTNHTDEQPDGAAEDVRINDARPDLTEATQPHALLTPAEVAAIFSVDPKTVTRWATTGQLTTVRTPGGHRRYHHTEVIRLFQQGYNRPETWPQGP